MIEPATLQHTFKHLAYYTTTANFRDDNFKNSHTIFQLHPPSARARRVRSLPVQWQLTDGSGRASQMAHPRLRHADGSVHLPRLEPGGRH